MSLAGSHPYRLEIPSDPDLLITARMFAAAVVDQTEFDDVIDDIKVAITEGVSLFIDGHPDARPIRLEAVSVEDRLLFTITGDGPIPEEDDLTREPRTGMGLVLALFPSLRLSTEPGGSVRVSFEVGPNPGVS